MCINVLRPRPRPFKFGWVSISLCYANISIFCPASSAHFPSSNVISSWSISSVCVYVLMGLCTAAVLFHAVWSTTHWWQTRWWPFLFSILYGVMYQEAEFATNIQQEGPLVISMKINPKSKEELPKDFLQLFVMKFVYYLHWTSYLISQ